MAICLMYHNIIAADAQGSHFFREHRPYVVTTRLFESHIAAAREAGWAFLSPLDAVRAKAQDKALLLTFDDSWENLQAETVLSAAQLSGIFFLNSALIGQRQMLARADVRRMCDAGHEIGSHGLTHDFFSTMSTQQLRRALFDSKASLEDMTGREVSFLSAPGGRYDRRAVELAQEAGYSAFFVSRPGFFHGARDTFVVNRICITADITEKRFTRFIDRPATGIAYRHAFYKCARLWRRLVERPPGDAA